MSPKCVKNVNGVLNFLVLFPKALIFISGIFNLFKHLLYLRIYLKKVAVVAGVEHFLNTFLFNFKFKVL